MLVLGVALLPEERQLLLLLLLGEDEVQEAEAEDTEEDTESTLAPVSSSKTLRTSSAGFLGALLK